MNSRYEINDMNVLSVFDTSPVLYSLKDALVIVKTFILNSVFFSNLTESELDDAALEWVIEI